MGSLTNEEKGALLLNSLAPDVVERVLAQLAPERRSRLRAVMNRLPVGPETQPILENVLRDLENALAESKAPPAAVPAAAPSRPIMPTILTMPTPPAPEPKPAPPAPSQDLSDPLAAMAKVSAERLAEALADESPRTVSLMLNALDSGLAGEVFKRLPATARAEVTVQFTSQEMPSLGILQRIAQAVVRKCEQVKEKPRFSEGAARHKKMADMLRLLDKPDRVKVLEALEAKDPEAAATVKGMLYRFEDVLRIDNRSMQKLLMEIDTKNLTVSLKGAADPVMDKFCANLSKRAQDNLREEMELMRSPPKDQIEQAQKEIVAIIQRLDLAGEIVMSD